MMEAKEKFMAVKSIKILSMVRNQAIPRNLDVEGFRVKISYYGQAVECDNRERLGHFARDCPLKGKCLSPTWAPCKRVS